MSDEKAITRKNQKIGEVISTRMAKTIVVQVTRRVSHGVYQRVVTRRKKFYAHDEEGVARTGDVVRIVESRPLSRLKKWQLAEVVRRAVQVSVEPESLEGLTQAPASPAGKR
jgi:small subunit ribosomal protein S17